MWNTPYGYYSPACAEIEVQVCSLARLKVVYEDRYTDCSLCLWNGPQRPGKDTPWTGDQWKNQDHVDPSILKNQLGYLRILLTWRDLLSLKLQWKTTYENQSEILERSTMIIIIINLSATGRLWHKVILTWLFMSRVFANGPGD